MAYGQPNVASLLGVTIAASARWRICQEVAKQHALL